MKKIIGIILTLAIAFSAIAVIAYADGEEHEHDFVVTVVSPGCEDGYTLHKCSICGYEYKDEVVPGLGHDFSEWSVDKNPTCTDDGEVSSVCNRCGAVERDWIPARGHDFVETVVAPGCVDGYTLHKCSVCGYEYKDELVPGLGHVWDTNGTVTKQPTHDEDGVLTRTCKWCGETFDVVLPKLRSDVAALFDDVGPTSWYVSYVDYVYTNGYMKGVSDTKFLTDGSMTRAMIATVLWRVEGEPEPASDCAFEDLTADWYAEAVRWAYGAGIVKGVSETKFAPDAKITREQVATMLYRYAIYKSADVSASGDLTTFSDSGNVSPWATAAMRWAVGEGLISGLLQHKVLILGPERFIDRAQFAAMLTRYLYK